MTLEVEICTYGLDGLQRVAQMTLPPVEGVRYRICMQNPDCAAVELPEALRRPDVDFFQHPTRGLSVNRNVALDRAEADIILIADDDLHYTAEGLRAVIDTFAADPTLDFATFEYSGPDGKTYPEQSCNLSEPLPRGYYITSFELAIRRSSLPASLRFFIFMGIGNTFYTCGEENSFLLLIIRNGLKGKFFPIEICQHPGLTSGSRRPIPGSLRSIGGYIWLEHSNRSPFQRFILAPLRILRRSARPGVAYFTALRHILHGFLSAPSHFLQHPR